MSTPRGEDAAFAVGWASVDLLRELAAQIDAELLDPGTRPVLCEYSPAELHEHHMTALELIERRTGHGQ